jgi:dTMP kinase
VSGRGRFVVFEGGEGSGKSTQARILADALDALLTHEPGGTELGLTVRRLVLGADGGPLDPRAEALLLLADRAQHVATVIRPALESSRDVVCDRFSGSTLAYQGHGRGLDVETLATMSRWASGGLEPDLVVLLDVAAGRNEGTPDRMEAEDAAFHTRVADGYRKLAAADPNRWVVVDGSGTIDDVAARVRKAVL